MKNGNSSDSESKVQKRIKNLSEFNQYADKTSGKLAGNFAGRTGKNNDSKQYMVKPIIDVKNKASNEIMYNWDPDSGILQCIREFLAGDFYRLLLNDQAPIIKLGKNEKDDSYFITSKIIENVETLKSFDKNKLDQVKGFEKVMASCSTLWEDDYNEENLLIKTINNDSYEIVKVDHGGTFYNLDRAIGTLNGYIESKDSKMFFTRHNRKFNELGYNELIQSGQLKFNINIFIQEIEGMLAKLPTEEVNNLFDAKLNYLLENNPKAKGLEKELLKYKTGLISNINFMRDTVLPDLKIIAKFSNVSDEFKNGL